jgi:hypothetical protein
MRRRCESRLAAAVVACSAAAVLSPRAASACPLCFAAGGEQTLHAYYLSAAVLSLLPLVILGVFAAWLWRRLKDDPS